VATRDQHWNYNYNVFDGFLDSEYSDPGHDGLQFKLDELIIATKGGRNEIVGIEDASDEEISEEKKRINGVLTTKALKDPATCQNHRLKLSTIRWRTPAGGHGHRQSCTTDVQSVRKAVTDATSND
jgi:hypothetical protein